MESERMQIKPGAIATLYRTFDQRDFDRFAALSGDDNPIHVDPAFAARTRFGRTVCHGMLLYSTICRALTDELGPGFAQREQELMFVSPTYTGEEVAVRLEVTAVQPESGLADISTVITRPDGAIACQGRTRVALPIPPAPPPYEGGGKSGSPTLAGEGSLKWLALGQAAEITRIFSEADLQEYRDLVGDTNPAFSGPGASPVGAGFPRPAQGEATLPLTPAFQVPGGLLGGLFSFLLGTRLPGRGTNWLKQRLTFPAPCYAGQEVTARVEIVRLRAEKDLVNLCTTCTVPGGQVVCEGEALVLVKDLEHA
jgi:acyl dehydratase